MACDSLGRPVRFLIAPGQSHDILAVPALLEGHRPAAVLADLAFVPVEGSARERRHAEPAPESIAASSFGGLVNRITHLRVFEGGRRN